MSEALPYRPILETLIGFDTTSRNSNLDLIAWVENFLVDHGVSSKRVANEDGSKANLYATVGPGAPGGIILSGHTDVVPVDGQPWTSDPWQVVEDGDKLVGRGVADMKGFIALALAHVPLFKTCTTPVHLAFSYDEEIGCLGAPSMIDAMRAELPEPSMAIIGEPTSMRPVVGHKGIAVFDVEVTGHEAHSSLVDHGVSANMVAADLMADLLRLSAELKERADPENGFDPPQATLTIGLMQGGTAANILARKASFTFDLRCPPGEDPLAIIAPFKKRCEALDRALASRFPECGVRFHQHSNAPPLVPEGSDDAVSFVRKLTGDNGAATQVAYAAEAGQFQRAGFTSIICGPGSIEQAHQPDEWIALEQLGRGARFMQNLARELA
ncbi:acetylornithine deacetylase [Erythrobacter litoralis]|uniref:Acetylornithine deacetylase n=1 Tax=Erythrobacter litoralis (strain HTCC2594) TaxID=314225 RepID=Q2NAF0_ERYLH|nr:acetylornithine deacetylase [Erythrobacter litoralis]ABC63341.1 acetylornithine deacetylase [Erythrobacter litoralis HTCC2594]